MLIIDYIYYLIIFNSFFIKKMLPLRKINDVNVINGPAEKFTAKFLKSF